MFVTNQKEFRFVHNASSELLAGGQLGSELLGGNDNRIDFPAQFWTF